MTTYNKATNFAANPSTDISRSVFQRDFDYKTALNTNYLYPVFCDEVLPGDSMTMDMSFFGRVTNPLVAPVIDNMYVDTFFFFVPNRIVWDNWVKMQGERKNPNDSIDFIVPKVRAGENGFGAESLADYFGINPYAPYMPVNALPFRMYNLIFNEWFRDENLQNSVNVPLGDEDDISNYTLLKRCKRHDYFTSTLPFAQKSDFGPVLLPLGDSAPVVFSNANGLAVGLDDFDVRLSRSASGNLAFGHPDVDNVVQQGTSGQASAFLVTDLSEATAANINQIRQAFQMQRLLERDARSGTRYVEILKGHWNVNAPSGLLQRPEFLGMQTTRVDVNTVIQTSDSTTQNTPTGNTTAFGTIGNIGHGFTKSFVEHGFIIGLMNIRADLTYQQGVERMWTRSTRYDYYMPVLAHLGEQTVLNKEIYAQGQEYDESLGEYVDIKTNIGTESNPIYRGDDDVFGYQERYAEYRYKPNQITGKLRSQNPTSLDVWHLSQEFDTLPVLNSSFIEENVPLERVLSVNDEPQFLVDIHYSYKCARPMPVRSIPGMVDHF